MKLNQKGYMLVEIIISFAIAMTIAFFLINLTIKFKNEEQDIYYSSKYISDKLAITKNIMNDLEENAIIEIGPCDGNCINFTVITEDGKEESRRLEITGKEIKYGKVGDDGYDTEDVSYFSKEIEKSLQLDPNSIKINVPSQETNYFTIEIPFYSLYNDEDYSIKLFAKTSEESATIMYHLNYPLYENENKIWNDLSGHANGILKGDSAIMVDDESDKKIRLNETCTTLDCVGFIQAEDTGNSDIKNIQEFTAEITMKINEFPEIQANCNNKYILIGNPENGGFWLAIWKATRKVATSVYYNGTWPTKIGNTEIQLKDSYDNPYNIAVTYNETKLTIYVDGKEDATFEVSGPITPPTAGTPLVIGSDINASASPAGCYLNGEISFVKVSNKALSKNELGKKEIDFDSTLRYYTLDEKDLIIKTDVKKINDNYDLSLEPKRDGYTFDDWYKEKEGATKITQDDKIQTKGVQVLYAQWE